MVQRLGAGVYQACKPARQVWIFENGSRAQMSTNIAVEGGVFFGMSILLAQSTALDQGKMMLKESKKYIETKCETH